MSLGVLGDHSTVSESGSVDGRRRNMDGYPSEASLCSSIGREIEPSSLVAQGIIC